MRNMFSPITVVILALMTAGCSTAQTDRLVNSLNNFNRGVAAVDETIRTISATLYAQCNNIHTISQTASDISGQCSRAGAVLSAGNSAINSLCQRDQVVNITSSIVAAGEAYKSVKSQLASAKAACG